MSSKKINMNIFSLYILCFMIQIYKYIDDIYSFSSYISFKVFLDHAFSQKKNTPIQIFLIFDLLVQILL